MEYIGKAIATLGICVMNAFIAKYLGEVVLMSLFLSIIIFIFIWD